MTTRTTFSRFTRAATRSTTLATLLSLAACGGGGGGGGSSPSGNAAPTSQASPVPVSTSVYDDTSNRSVQVLRAASPTFYNRDYEYPALANLPLQFITTSSGKRLSARVALPANQDGTPAKGPFPVILVQSAYNTNVLSQMFVSAPGNGMLGVSDYFLVRRGYAMVAVDAMGTGASEGGWELLGEDEQKGFAETVDWVGSQPWSNGKIGVAGVSYMGISSLFAAEQRPDAISAVFASLPMGDAYRGTVSTGGLLNGVFMSNWMGITERLSTLNITTELLNPGFMQQLIATTKEHVDQIDSYYIPLINAALHGDPVYNFDGDFWHTRSPIQHIDNIKAPTFLLGALHDIFQRDVPMLYERLKHNGVDTRLVIHDGEHFVNFLTQHIGNEQVPAVDYLMLQWFDKYLRGMDTHTEAIPDVVQYVKNYPSASTPAEHANDSFVTTTTWPHPQAHAERWFLHGDMTLDRATPATTESSPVMTEPVAASGEVFRTDGFLQFVLQLNDGSECSSSYDQWMMGLTMPKTCFWDNNQSPVQKLSFVSDAMPEDYFINGPIQADIYLDSTVADAVVAVMVEELSDKQALPITGGQQLASLRAVETKRSRFLGGEMIQPWHPFTEASQRLLSKGEVVKVPVEIFPTSALIRKGNRLRISVSPSNQAQGILNYPRRDSMMGGVSTIHIDQSHPSSIVIPAVPLSALN